MCIEPKLSLLTENIFSLLLRMSRIYRMTTKNSNKGQGSKEHKWKILALRITKSNIYINSSNVQSF